MWSYPLLDEVSHFTFDVSGNAINHYNLAREKIQRLDYLQCENLTDYFVLPLEDSTGQSYATPFFAIGKDGCDLIAICVGISSSLSTRDEYELTLSAREAIEQTMVARYGCELFAPQVKK